MPVVVSGRREGHPRHVRHLSAPLTFHSVTFPVVHRGPPHDCPSKKALKLSDVLVRWLIPASFVHSLIQALSVYYIPTLSCAHTTLGSVAVLRIHLCWKMKRCSASHRYCPVASVDRYPCRLCRVSRPRWCTPLLNESIGPVLA